MDLKIFFDVIDESVYETITDTQSFAHAIRMHDTKFPDWKHADIAIIGIVESRGNVYTAGVENAANLIRKKLFKLKKGAAGPRVVDLGNLRSGIKLEDSYLRLREVCEILMQYNVIPLIIGGTHDMDFGQFLAYEKFEKLISIVNVDAFIDVESNAGNGANRHHTHQILMHEPNYLFNFANIAYQSFLNDPETLDILEKLNFENYRIGQVKEKIEEMEPVVRQADMLSFDITSVRMSDAPGNPNATPFGLTGEEACRLAWYAGLSHKLSSFGIYEYDPTEDIKGHTASVIGTMLWYFVEGYYNRKSDLNFNGENFTRFIVTMKNNPHKLVFYKNKLTEMWWMEVPFPTGQEKYARVSIVPCSYSDYEIATKGELPNRWIQNHAKLI